MKTAHFHLLSILLIALILSAFNPKEIFASNVIYQNNFETENIDTFPSNWSIARNIQWSNLSNPCMNGSIPAQWQVKEAFGSKRVGISISGNGCVTEIVPTNLTIPDLSNYQYDLDVTFPNSVYLDRNVAFKYHNGGEWYGIKFIHPTNIEFQKIMHPFGYNSQFGNAVYSTGFTPNNTYHMTIKNINNLIEFFIEGVLVKSVSDQNPILTQGTIALQASVGSLGANTTYFDNIVVTDLSIPTPTPTPSPTPTPTINVPYFSQRNPLWSSHLYDSINKTIGQVGCALTSAAMVLKFHGYNKLPDGQDLNPDTLNTWLKSKKAILRNGNISFPMIASLTNSELISEKPEVSHLEYTKSRPKFSLIDDILSNQFHPLIFEQSATTSPTGRHFVVAEKVINTKTSYGIKDPYQESKTEFNIPPDKLVSVRYLKPENTNFSYLILQSDQLLFPLITNASNNQTGTPDGETVEENIPNSLFELEGTLFNSVEPGNEEGSSYWNTEIKYPETGSYTLTFTTPQSGWYNFELYSFNKEGSAFREKQYVFIDSEHPTNYTLIYQQDGNIDFTNISKMVSFDTLINLINTSYEQQWIMNQKTHRFLVDFATNAKKVNAKNPLSGKVLLEALDKHFDQRLKQGGLIDPGYSLLKTEIGLLQAKLL